MSYSFRFLPVLLLTGLAAAQPVIYPRGVATAAGYLPAGAPGGSIARGSIFAIFGSDLGPALGVAVTAYPIGASLGGVSITATLGNSTVDVLPLYASAGQINALMPSNAPLGLVSLRVNYNGRTSNPSPVRVVNAAFGVFAAPGAGPGPGAIVNYISPESQPVNSFSTTARPGHIAILYGTGLGPITAPDNVAPPAQSLPTRVEVFVGGKPAAISYSGRSPCCSGLDQIVFTVPDSAPSGCWVPVYARTAGSTIGNAVTMAISRSGGPCQDEAGPLARTLITGGKAGVLRLVRTSVRQEAGVRAPVEVATDAATFDFAVFAPSRAAFGSLVSEPPPGACMLLNSQSDVLGDGQFPALSNVTRRLDAGASITLDGPRGSRTVAPPAPSLRAAFLGSFAPFAGTLGDQLALDPGDYTLSGSGADTGAYQARLRVPAPFTWTNRDTIDVVDRSKPLTLYWTGAGPAQRLAVIGASVDLPTSASAMFYCVIAPGETFFTVPPEVLSALPATRSDPLQSKSVLYLTNMPMANATAFTAPGLDTGLAAAVFQSGKTVTFR